MQHPVADLRQKRWENKIQKEEEGKSWSTTKSYGKTLAHSSYKYNRTDKSYSEQAINQNDQSNKIKTPSKIANRWSIFSHLIIKKVQLHDYYCFLFPLVWHYFDILSDIVRKSGNISVHILTFLSSLHWQKKCHSNFAFVQPSR